MTREPQQWRPVPEGCAERYAATPVGQQLGWTGSERWVERERATEDGRRIVEMRQEGSE